MTTLLGILICGIALGGVLTLLIGAWLLLWLWQAER